MSLNLSTIKSQVKLIKSDELHNVSDDLIDLYINRNITILKVEMNIDIELDTSIDWSVPIVDLTLYDLGVRGVEGFKSYNEGGQSATFKTKDEMISWLKRYRRPANVISQ